MKEFRGKPLVAGEASGELLVSQKSFTFAHGVHPATGLVTDVRSDIRGKVVKQKVLVYPYGKGSTTSSAWFLETVRLGNNPSAVVVKDVDNGTLVGSVLASFVYHQIIPVILCRDEEFFRVASSSKFAFVSEEGVIRVE
jgi:predicted aconitase with swiveling domain